MKYLIIDKESGKHYANISDLVNQYPNPKDVAFKCVNSMNKNMLNDGFKECFSVLEVPDNFEILNRWCKNGIYLEELREFANSEYELIEAINIINSQLPEEDKIIIKHEDDKVIYMCNYM